MGCFVRDDDCKFSKKYMEEITMAQVDIMDDFEMDIFWNVQEGNRELTQEEIDMLNKHHLEKLHASTTSNQTQTK